MQYPATEGSGTGHQYTLAGADVDLTVDPDNSSAFVGSPSSIGITAPDAGGTLVVRTADGATRTFTLRQGASLQGLSVVAVLAASTVTGILVTWGAGSDVEFATGGGGGSSPESVRIAWIGDSHGQHIKLALVDGNYYGMTALTSPLDWMWNGSARAPFFLANSQSGSTVNTTDPNLAANTGLASPLTWIPGMLRAIAPDAFEDIGCANVSVGGATSGSWPGGSGGALWQARGNATPDIDTATAAGVPYVFSNSGAPYTVPVGVDAATTLVNLANAINGLGTAGTLINPYGYCPNPTSPTLSGLLKFFALNPGVAGNSLTIASSNTSRITALDGSSSPVLSTNLSGGSAPAAPGGLYWNMQQFFASGAFVDDADQVVFLVDLGSNDAARAGYNGRGTQTALGLLFAQLAVDYPGAIVIPWLPTQTSVAGYNTLLATVVRPAILAAATAAGQAQIPVLVDCSALVALGVGQVVILESDGIHLTPYGYSLVAQAFALAIAYALGKISRAQAEARSGLLIFL